MTYDLCCIGHITLDKVITPATTAFLPGGTAWYVSQAVANLPLRYLLVTAVAESERPFVTTLEKKGVAVRCLPSRHTVFFENRYDDKGDRSQRVLQQADPFLAGQLNNIDAAIFHLGPLLAADIAPESWAALAARGLLSLDVQGLLRKVKGEKVVPVDWAQKKALLPLVQFVKASEEELFVVTGESNAEAGARCLAEWGAKEIIVTKDSRGSTVLSGGEFYPVPAFAPTTLTDATGCGDTYMAGYLYKRLKGAGIEEAGTFAAAMATAKLAHSGPFTGVEEDVNAIVLEGTALTP